MVNPKIRTKTPAQIVRDIFESIDGYMSKADGAKLQAMLCAELDKRAATESAAIPDIKPRKIADLKPSSLPAIEVYMSDMPDVVGAVLIRPGSDSSLMFHPMTGYKLVGYIPYVPVADWPPTS
jgi:hypothetical protein